MTMPLFQMASCCFSCFKGGFIVIVRMRSSMIVRCVSKFFYCCIQSFFCLVFMLIDQFIFQRVEIPFHWCIIIWISGFTHTLCDCHPLTVLFYFFNSNLPVFSALFINHKVNMKFQTVLCCRKRFFPVHQGSDTASNQFLLPLHCLF